MKIMISYFYQVRFMKPYMIPLSTCCFDPKWYYNQKQGQWYIDKNGVINGLRAEPFMPGPLCHNLCRGQENCGGPANADPQNCDFLRMYHVQLCGLNFEEILERFERLGKNVQEFLHFSQDPVMVLLVHEAPNNPCSERVILKKWFQEHNYNLEEFIH